jgi:hypothetical protein
VYRAGAGEVRFWVECDGGTIAECSATSAGTPCDSGLHAATSGTLGCWYEIVSGNPGDIEGYCYEPANPDAVLRPILKGP